MLLALPWAIETNDQNPSIGNNNSDRCCVASCYKVPCPSESQAQDTNSCVSACPQGTGSPADSRRYADCEQACYSSYFLPATQQAGATSTTGSASATATANGNSATVNGNSATATASGSGASASGASGSSMNSAKGAKQTTNAASHIQLGVSPAGLAGLVVAAFAL